MKTTDGITLSLTKHAKKQAKAKGFPVASILDMWSEDPTIQPSRSHRGQYRVCGSGICLVGIPKGKSFIVITLYTDQALTPPRDDQTDSKGTRYRKRYEQGLGRG